MIPTKKQLEQNRYKLVDGVWHKLCNGPAHDEPIYLPATSKYFYARKTSEREGQLLSRCRLCQNWSKLKSPGSEHGWIEVYQVRHFYVEAVNRVGLMEVARRTGITYTAITDVLVGRSTYVQKAKFKKVLLELISMRRKNENNISSGSRWRVVRRTPVPNGKKYCTGCGTSLDDFTDDCEQCQNRRFKRQGRAKLSA